jgi:hypothetical protein
MHLQFHHIKFKCLPVLTFVNVHLKPPQCSCNQGFVKIHRHCGKISDLCVRALETGKKGEPLVSCLDLFSQRVCMYVYCDYLAMSKSRKQLPKSRNKSRSDCALWSLL